MNPHGSSLLLTGKHSAEVDGRLIQLWFECTRGSLVGGRGLSRWICQVAPRTMPGQSFLYLGLRVTGLGGTVECQCGQPKMLRNMFSCEQATDLLTQTVCRLNQLAVLELVQGCANRGWGSCLDRQPERCRSRHCRTYLSPKVFDRLLYDLYLWL